jgi:hypothetical protein
MQTGFVAVERPGSRGGGGRGVPGSRVLLAISRSNAFLRGSGDQVAHAGMLFMLFAD